MAYFRCIGGNGGGGQEPTFCGSVGSTGIKIKDGRYIYGFGTAITNQSYTPLKEDGTAPTLDTTKSFHCHIKLKHLQSNISGYQFMKPPIIYTSSVATGNIFVLEWIDNSSVTTMLRISKTDLPLNVGTWYTVDIIYNAAAGTVTLTGSDGAISHTVTEPVNKSNTLSNQAIGNVDGYDLKLMFDLADCYWEQDGVILWGNKAS